ncbi:hypothetical protein N7509_002487 [Penicillium cosmopolitanum]|uniref:Uncharacterized protein n=1 Tax=Penicillium cosmopolitanum TaxID=1131564 RepID=A0A9W9W972_9EURO|nr:uncharacterized protein N7509_002487 [Penicillium cosmopolitanum]KAJ5408604.1 hypothetical protein N7509_002487 [Penicillium cosmopolitanum]
MMVYDHDVKELTAPIRGENNLGAQPKIISQRTVYNASGGSQVHSMIELEVTLLDRKSRRMCPWERVPAIVQDGYYIRHRSERLDGPWTRARFYTMNQPDGSLCTQIANDKSSLAVKRITQKEIKPLVSQPASASQPYDVGSPLSSVSPRSTPERANTPIKEQIAQTFHKESRS